jgi:hypothetical protein
MTYRLVLTFACRLPLLHLLKPPNQKSINDAISRILMSKLNALNSWKNSLAGKLSDFAEAGEVNQISYRGSSKFDAPALILYGALAVAHFEFRVRNRPWILALRDPQGREPSSNG